MSSPMNQFDRRRLLVITGAAAAAGFLRGGMVWATEGPSSYTPTWPSVDQHPPAPEWFQDAKFGIYFHWGVFSVPAFANEWYPRSMYINGSAENNHHKQVYGDPSAWPYHNFINGARDKSGNWVQFAPKLKSAGGNFDPDEWARLFVDAGAKFAGPVAEHHDGYSMWNSTVNEWNSVRTGPKLDLVRLHADAIRAKGLKFIVTLHHMYHFSGYFDQAPQQSTSSLRKLYGQLGWGTHEQLWYERLREVIDGYQPDLIWQDGGLQYINETHRLGMGDYLKRFGESLYATRAWTAFGEGPTQMGGGSFVTPREGTNRDIRFTRNKANTALYATVMGWPGSTLSITTLGSNRINLTSLTSVQLLGSTAGSYVDLPNRSQSGSVLNISMPSANAPFSAPAYVVKLTFSGQIPTLDGMPNPTGWVRITNAATGLVLDSGGNVSSGSRLKQWNWDGNTNLQWQLVDLGGGWYRIVNRTNGMVADSWGNSANGAFCQQSAWNGGNNQQWRLNSVGNGRHQIINRGTGTALDSLGNSTPGSGTAMWAPNSSPNNHWTIAST